MLIATFPFYSGFNGFIAARFYKFWNGSSWKSQGALSAVFLPYFFICAILAINAIEMIETGKANLLQEDDISVLLILVPAINCIFTMVGSFIGFSRTTMTVP